MSGKQHVHENKNNEGAVRKAENVANADWSEEQATTQQATGTSESLPQHKTTLAQRRQAILQLQRSRGNNFVMRQAMPSAMRQEDQAPAETTAPSEISSGGNRVSTEGGVTIDSGGIVRINSAITQTSGILQAGTIIADNVIASSYTPGAGNIM
jgi:hypothetical protein